MNLDRVDSGRDLANDLNVIIEIPMNADPIKYEIDKATGALFVDRFVSTAGTTRATTDMCRTRSPTTVIRWTSS